MMETQRTASKNQNPNDRRAAAAARLTNDAEFPWDTLVCLVVDAKGGVWQDTTARDASMALECATRRDPAGTARRLGAMVGVRNRGERLAGAWAVAEVAAHLGAADLGVLWSPVVALLAVPDAAVRDQAARAIEAASRRLGADPTTEFRQLVSPLFTDPWWRFRMAAVAVAGAAGGLIPEETSWWLDRVAPLLEDADSEVRSVAATAVGAIAVRLADSGLLEPLLHHPNHRVATAAATGIDPATVKFVERDPVGAWDWLAGLLGGTDPNRPHGNVRSAAADALPLAARRLAETDLPTFWSRLAALYEASAVLERRRAAASVVENTSRVLAAEDPDLLREWLACLLRDPDERVQILASLTLQWSAKLLAARDAGALWDFLVADLASLDRHDWLLDSAVWAIAPAATRLASPGASALWGRVDPLLEEATAAEDEGIAWCAARMAFAALGAAATPIANADPAGGWRRLQRLLAVPDWADKVSSVDSAVFDAIEATLALEGRLPELDPYWLWNQLRDFLDFLIAYIDYIDWTPDDPTDVFDNTRIFEAVKTAADRLLRHDPGWLWERVSKLFEGSSDVAIYWGMAVLDAADGGLDEFYPDGVWDRVVPYLACSPEDEGLRLSAEWHLERVAKALAARDPDGLVCRLVVLSSDDDEQVRKAVRNAVSALEEVLPHSQFLRLQGAIHLPGEDTDR